MLNILPRVVLLMSLLSLGACSTFVGYPDAEYGSYSGNKSRVSYQFDSSCDSDQKRAIKKAGEGYFYNTRSASNYSYQFTIGCRDGIDGSMSGIAYNVLAMLTLTIVPMSADRYYAVDIDIKNSRDEHIDFFSCKEGNITRYDSVPPFSIPMIMVAAVHPNIVQVRGSKHSIFRQEDRLAFGAVAQSATSCFKEIIGSGVLK